MKVNIDAAVLERQGGRSGGVFRISRGYVAGCFLIPLLDMQAFEAELFTAIYTIELAEYFHGTHFGLNLTLFM